MKELEKSIIDLFQEMGRGQGLKDSLLLAIFAKLYMEPEPVAMEELAKQTGYSLASVSMKVNNLIPIMGVKKIKKPGSKKIYLYMEKDILKIWKDALIRKEEFVVKKVKEKMPAILHEYKDKVKTRKDKKKYAVIENYYRQVLKFEAALRNIIRELDKIK
ncbi:hypothetical protein GF323_06610 [Candidatus Woesearchaeota archaeon]|nr:hypothetical protein [Candidatus Woesearchaeota archaeon]